jgi:hypothetical protein
VAVLAQMNGGRITLVVDSAELLTAGKEASLLLRLLLEVLALLLLVAVDVAMRAC